MSKRTRHIAQLTLVVIAALMLAGCGGGEAAPDAATPDAAAPVTPAVDGMDGTVSDPNADPNAPAIDPATGLPIDGGVGAAITVPNLDGGNVDGGLNSLEGGSDVFHSFGYYGGLVSSKNESADAGTGGSPADNEFGTGTGGYQTATPGGTEETHSIAPYTQAKVAVNGKIYLLTKNGTFPKAPDQLFRLTGITATSVEITLLAGEFSDGSAGVTLKRGDTFSLVNQSDSMTYKVKLIATMQGTANMGFGN